MLKTFYSFSFSLLLFLFGSNSLSQQFFDDFDSYTAGQLLGCQDSINWTNWFEIPCHDADALVSDAQSYSSQNSVLISQWDDLIKDHENITSGKWYTSFQFYLPSGKIGAFGMQSKLVYGYWFDSSYSVFACSFNGDGTALFTTKDTIVFNYMPDTWQTLEVIIDLDNDSAEFWLGGSLSGGSIIKTFTWTDGEFPGKGPLQIATSAWYGYTPDVEMYFDDYWFGPYTITPVELTSFTANVNSYGQPVLSWATATETNNGGFEVEKKTVNGKFSTIGFIEGHGTTAEEKRYSYIDESVYPGKYVYRLKQIDFDGQFEYSDEIELEVTPSLAFSLNQNYPNPFNPLTKIKFSLAEAGNIKLTVYNTLGEEVSVLVNNYKEAGFFEINFDAVNLPSGTYIYRLETPNFIEAKKMLLIK